MIPSIEQNPDRRRFFRISKDSIVCVGRPKHDDHRAMAQMVDLSQGGIRFQCVGEEVALDEVLIVSVTNGRHTADIVGKVIRVREVESFVQEVALAFIKGESSDALEAILELERFPPFPEALITAILNCPDDVEIESDVSLSENGLRFMCVGQRIEVGDTLELKVVHGEEIETIIGRAIHVEECPDASPGAQDIKLAFISGERVAAEILESCGARDFQPIALESL